MLGVDVTVDVTLCIVGAAMHASAGPEHRENVGKALGKLKNYGTKTGGATSLAGLSKASEDFAALLKLGGKKAVEALSAVASAPSAPSKLSGLAEKAKALDGINGVAASGS